jgi:hypothetical protein
VSVSLAGVQARREIGMAWRQRAQLTPAAERFRTFVRSLPATSTRLPRQRLASDFDVADLQ